MKIAWLFILLTFFPGQINIPLKKKPTPPPSDHLEWRNLEDSYISLAVVKPILVNKSNTTISFSYAHLLRQDELTEKWSAGDSSRKCYSYIEPGQRPHTRRI